MKSAAVPSGALGAFINEALRVEGASQGALGNLTVAVKDIFDIEGLITGFGNPNWQETHRPAQRHAAAVQAPASLARPTWMRWPTA